VTGQHYVGAVTFGIGALLTTSGPRTMHSFIPEFEAELSDSDRLPVKEFSEKLSAFFLDRWNGLHKGPKTAGQNIEFIVGGYDQGEAYGRVYLFKIPEAPAPIEQSAGPGEFGMTFGGQGEMVHRLLAGFDPGLVGFLTQEFALDAGQAAAIAGKLSARFPNLVPFQFLPLQDCVDMATFFIQGTISLQRFSVGIRGVGGRVDVATITPAGFTWVAQKAIGCAAPLNSREGQ